MSFPIILLIDASSSSEVLKMVYIRRAISLYRSSNACYNYIWGGDMQQVSGVFTDLICRQILLFFTDWFIFNWIRVTSIRCSVLKSGKSWKNAFMFILKLITADKKIRELRKRINYCSSITYSIDLYLNNCFKIWYCVIWLCSYETTWKCMSLSERSFNWFYSKFSDRLMIISDNW